MKILLVNSDLAKNRGDRAITEGVMQLIKEQFPKAKITGISEYAERDAKWFDSTFLDMDTQSLSPIDLFKLLKEAKNSDLVLWGGGELLKDYTNKAALWYWVGKMWLVSLVNSNLYGAYQGIGPTGASSSKKLIRFIVNRCKLFAVRDQESYEKLVSWGCDPERVLPASDPAVLPSPEKLSPLLRRHLQQGFDIDTAFLKDFVSIGPRDWFHYKPGGLIPYKYRKKLLKLLHIKPRTNKKADKKHANYLRAMTIMCDTVLARGHNILFVPMHMGEEDIKLCDYLKQHVAHPEKVRILDSDLLSPTEVRTIMAYAQAMVGFRLHSTIIATSSFVPCINYYYVDKGRVYFDQIGQSKYAFPIEYLLAHNFGAKFEEVFDGLMKDKKTVSSEIRKNLKGLRHTIRETFSTMVDSHE